MSDQTLILPKGMRLEYEGAALWLIEDTKVESPMLVSTGGPDGFVEFVENAGQGEMCQPCGYPHLLPYRNCKKPKV